RRIVLELAPIRAGELRQVAADAAVDARRVGQQRRPDARLVATRRRLGQRLGRGLDHLARPPGERRRQLGVDDARRLQRRREAGHRVAPAPGLLLLLAAIAELAARPRSALMQEAITDRLD